VGLSGGGGVGELTQTIEESVTDPPSNLVATEDVSPRVIRLLWTPATGEIGSYNIYRQPPFPNGNPMNVPIGQLIFHANTNQFEFDDTVTCNPAGYTYQVSAVQSAASTNPLAESERIGPVSTGQNGELLTGCYTPPVFSSPAPGSSPLQGSIVTTIWTLQDKTNKSGVFANNPGSNSLVAIGPISNDVACAPGSVTGSTPRSKIAPAGSGISFANNQFTFSWNTAQGFIGWPAMNLPPGLFPPGCYLLEDDLDSGQPAFGGQPASAFQVQIYLSDVNESVQVTTASLPDAIEGVPYNQTFQESGGVAPVNWTIASGSLPPNLALNSASGTLSGTPTAPGIYTFAVQVTDSIGDFGTQTLTLRVNAAVTNTLDSGAGSLRQAILDVNFAPTGSQPVGIIFIIPGGGVQTITPLSALPALTQPTILDGTTQPGYTGTPLIELNGTNAGNPANGLDVAGGSSTIAGLVINRFNGNGIQIDAKGGDVIQANYIGTDKTGATAAANSGDGIQIIAVPNNTVGGAAASMRNIISGNGGEGLRIDGTLATGNIVRGNYIGTDVTGSTAVGNAASGVYIRRAPGNSVIGNTVSGNVGFAGITICGDQLPAPGFCGGGDIFGIDETSNASGNIIQGNLVGTNSLGTAALGNNQAGVSIDGAPNTVVGGGNANTISFNGTNDVQIFDTGANGNQIKGNTIQGTGANNDVGISVGVLSNTALTGNTLTGNAISGHAGLGIDLNPAGVNPNTAGGANNYPVISSAQASSGMIMGTLNGPANATFTIEFFSNSACNASGNGEGAVFLGSTVVMTDSSGNVVFAAPVGGLVTGNTITATSTDASGTTSEFSTCVPVS
jgi:parallel beta-helix repeat protein